MPAPSRIEQIREIGGRLPQGGLALTAMITFVALLALGPVVPKTALWHVAALTSAHKDSSWAGHLEDPTAAQQPAPAPLTSASYTSGFDKAAAGLAPAPAPQPKSQQARDPLACPDDLNCAFRTAKPVPRPAAEAASVAPASAAPSVLAAPAPRPQPQPRGLAILTSRLPSPHTLLKPFTFVADTFTGFIRKL
jgi:hypothetical protein